MEHVWQMQVLGVEELSLEDKASHEKVRRSLRRVSVFLVGLH